jgi:GntR family transcriptional regulator, transcriptional repressor for pyruvate dehydrogenase complex
VNFDLAPLARSTTAQAAAERILQSIRGGALAPGEQLPPEKELMDRLGVGRSTVREALQILATLNLVRAVPGLGTFVHRPTAGELFRSDLIGCLIGNAVALELLEAREMIEPPLIRLACLRGTEEDFGRIDRMLDEHDRANRHGQPVSPYAARFHIMIAEAARNRVGVTFMSSILETLMARGRRYDEVQLYQTREIEEHRALLEVMRARDGDRAAEMLLRHIVDSATAYDHDGAWPPVAGSAA